ncbi:MAG: hypothetical protein R2881_02570 [Eubacteriales bacterium]
MALDYFNTVYLDDGSVAPLTKYTFSDDYLKTIIHPVAGGLIKTAGTIHVRTARACIWARISSGAPRRRFSP